LRIKTLASIPRSVARHHGLTVEELLCELEI